MIQITILVLLGYRVSLITETCDSSFQTAADSSIFNCMVLHKKLLGNFTR